MPFSILKGVIENIFSLLRIEDVTFLASDKDPHLSTQAEIVSADGKQLGTIGTLKDTYRLAFGIKKTVTVADIRFKDLIAYINYYPKYVKPNPFAHIKLDLTYTSDQKHIFADIKTRALKTSKLLQSVELVSQFEQQVSLRFTFAAEDMNITDEEAQKELEAIKKALS